MNFFPLNKIIETKIKIIGITKYTAKYIAGVKPILNKLSKTKEKNVSLAPTHVAFKEVFKYSPVGEMQ